MKIFNLLISILFFNFFSPENAQSATLYSFDNPFLYAIKDKNEIYGYFSSYARGSACVFFFHSLKKNKKSSLLIHTYESDGEYPDQDTKNKNNGKIVISKNKWTLQAPNLNAGCKMRENIVFPDFTQQLNVNNNNTFKVTGITKVKAIRMVNAESTLHDKNGSNFSPRDISLGSGDIVVIVKDESEYFLVRHYEPATGNTIEGWILSKNIVNPFPE